MGGRVPQYDKETVYAKEIEYEGYKKGGFEMETKELILKYPPKVFNPNKKHLLSCIDHSKFSGSLFFARYFEMTLPILFNSTGSIVFVMREDLFDYSRTNLFISDDVVEWHVNFADEALFGHYGGGLYAQDEMQVAEMPILASVREYLLRGCFENENLIPSTRNGDFCSP